jgi:hypothetical protein
MKSWVVLETSLREALPVCSVAPPTQPSELLAALRINGKIGPEEEARIRALRQKRNRVAHTLEEPPPSDADAFEAAVEEIQAKLRDEPAGAC